MAHLTRMEHVRKFDDGSASPFEAVTKCYGADLSLVRVQPLLLCEYSSSQVAAEPESLSSQYPLRTHTAYDVHRPHAG